MKFAKVINVIKEKESFRFLHNCPECFWAYHKGCEWQQAVCVSKATRLRLCKKLGLTHVKVPDDYVGERTVGLGEPSQMSCKAILASGGGECWFSSIYYLLVGRKIG